MEYLLNRLKLNWMAMSDSEIKILQECSDNGKFIIIIYLGNY